jgi:hypothetical protein
MEQNHKKMYHQHPQGPSPLSPIFHKNTTFSKLFPSAGWLRKSTVCFEYSLLREKALVVVRDINLVKPLSNIYTLGDHECLSDTHLF